MSTGIQAIETRYKGCLFRSRLEARWAVFFDALGINWEYEAQGYAVDMATATAWWLPDFWLPDERLLVEVKGDEESLLKDRRVYGWAVDYGSLPAGVDGILFLGPIPQPTLQSALGHSVIKWDSGVIREWAYPMSSHRGGKRFFIFSRGSSAVGTEDLPGDEGIPFLTPLQEFVEMDEAVYRAYNAARAARFEHGENVG